MKIGNLEPNPSLCLSKFKRTIYPHDICILLQWCNFPYLFFTELQTLQMHGNSFERKLAMLKGKPQNLEVRNSYEDFVDPLCYFVHVLWYEFINLMLDFFVCLFILYPGIPLTPQNNYGSQMKVTENSNMLMLSLRALANMWKTLMGIIITFIMDDSH